MPETTYNIIHCGHRISPNLNRDKYMDKKWYSEEEIKTFKEDIQIWFEMFDKGDIATFHEAWKELDDILENR